MVRFDYHLRVVGNFRPNWNENISIRNLLKMLFSDVCRLSLCVSLESLETGPIFKHLCFVFFDFILRSRARKMYKLKSKEGSKWSGTEVERKR